MGKANRTVVPQDSTPGRQAITKTLKWVGGVTAVLSLVFGLHQLTELVSGYRQRDREVKELLSTSKMQQQAADYSAAWNSLEQADRLSKGGREVRAAQESVAIAWLENAHVNPEQQKFGDITGKVVPTLDRAVSTAEEHGRPIFSPTSAGLNFFAPATVFQDRSPTTFTTGR